MPKDIQKDLVDVLARVCRVQEVQLNVLEKELLFFNLTVRHPSSLSQNQQQQQQLPSLRIGRIRIKWDSYMKPCVDIEVDDVDILVEFSNLMLTRNNWNELQDAGFPPELLVGESTGPSSTFVRVGSMDLSGNVRAIIRSLPLGGREICPPLQFDMDSLDADLTALLEAGASNNGRRGVTTDELSGLLQRYFSDKLRDIVKSTALDVFLDEKDVTEQAKNIVSDASKAVLGYVNQASNKKRQEIQGSVKERFQRLTGDDNAQWLGVLGEDIAKRLMNDADGNNEGNEEIDLNLERIKGFFRMGKEKLADIVASRSRAEEFNGEHTVSTPFEETEIFFPDFP